MVYKSFLSEQKKSGANISDVTMEKGYQLSLVYEHLL